MLSTSFSFCMHETLKNKTKTTTKLAPLADYSLTRTSRESQDSRGDSKLVCPTLDTVVPFLHVTMSRCRRVPVAFSLCQGSAVRFPKCIVYSPILVFETVKRRWHFTCSLHLLPHLIRNLIHFWVALAVWKPSLLRHFCSSDFSAVVLTECDYAFGRSCKVNLKEKEKKIFLRMNGIVLPKSGLWLEI